MTLPPSFGIIVVLDVKSPRLAIIPPHEEALVPGVEE